ncbi:unnamed protein product [Adineta ricciae]|uniref:Uncharacterized protein n=1 Tax=Adineta ricciae TaxID=249248 RepID=A0A816EKW5_ADIRI|nr:unnamed protein product [Adineta ricciae]
MFFLKKYFLELNLFKSDTCDHEVEDCQTRRLNIIATRIYLFLIICLLFGIGLTLSLINKNTLIIIKNPSREQFDALPSGEQCQCSQISLPYGKFMSLNVTYHQVCSSDFVSDRWINAINFGANSSYFHVRDFRAIGSAQFQALAGFCRLAKSNVERSIDVFSTNALLSPYVLPDIAFHSQMNASIGQFRSVVSNTFRAQLRLIIQIILNNRLISGLLTNAYYKYPSHSEKSNILDLSPIWYVHRDGVICSCDIDICNKTVSGIFDIFETSISTLSSTSLHRIPGHSAGCYPVNAILQSTLECFYDKICLGKLMSVIPTRERFRVMDKTQPSRYRENSLVQSIVDKLMVEEWITNISYNKYYYQCAPTSCTFFKVSRYSLLYVLTQLISLLASMALVLRSIIPPIVQFVHSVRHRKPTSRTPLCRRLYLLTILIRTKLLRLNMFRRHSSTSQQIRHQSYATRLYFLLIFISTVILAFYTLLDASIHSETVHSPTQLEYMQLEQDHLHSLSCSCKKISMPYSTFTTVRAQYHQLCSSDFISKHWITYLESAAGSIAFLDFRDTAGPQFQSLTIFCQQAEQLIHDASQIFVETQFVSSYIVPSQSFQIQVNSFVDDWIVTTVNNFMHTIQIIRATIQGNQLLSGPRNGRMIFDSSNKVIIEPRKFANCSCLHSPSCRTTTVLIKYNATLKKFVQVYSIPNFFTGCYPIDALFASELTCFYMLSCLSQIHRRINSTSIFTVSPLNENLNNPNEIIESIVSRLMVDKWLRNVSFDSYYNACSPSSCTFQYERYNTFLYAVSTIVSVFGGLSLALKLLIMIGLELMETIGTSSVSCVSVFRWLKQLFLCKNERDVIKRLHFVLVFTTLLTIYLSSAFRPTVTTGKVEKPSISKYKNLLEQYHDSFQCTCSQSSIKYKTFLSITAHFHQLCSSHFVSSRWIDYLYDLQQPMNRFNR